MAKNVVRVTSKGQATIPIELREKYGITAPGLVRFVERDGRLVVEPLPTPDEMKGVLKEAAGDRSLTEELMRERERDLKHEEDRVR